MRPPNTGGQPNTPNCGFSHPGRQREENEDAFGSFVDERLFIVADGMGGPQRGRGRERHGGRRARDVLPQLPRRPAPALAARRRTPSVSLGANLLRVGIKVANDKIRAAAAGTASARAWAPTIVAMAIGDAQLTIAHAGDSRAYRLRGGEIKRLTRDHSIMEEMLAARPEMAEAEIAAFAHRNVVTKSLGSKEEIEPTLYVNTLAPGDVYLLCSDGLWGSVPDGKIAAIIGARPTSRRPVSC